MTIDQFNFAGKKAFVRVDFNVPLDENFNITDDTRMRAALPTLKKILADGGSVIIGSHLGRPKGPADKFSLKHILKHLEELLGVEVQFANDCMGEEAAVKAAALQPGEVLLLENLRFYAEEEGKPRGLAEDATDEEKKAAKAAVKESQKEFTKKLASYADCYVNDAFGTAHRAHASTALIAKYFDKDNKMFGYLMEKEVKAVDKVLNDIQRPFTAIMGGSKVSSKIEIIENLLNKTFIYLAQNHLSQLHSCLIGHTKSILKFRFHTNFSNPAADFLTAAMNNDRFEAYQFQKCDVLNDSCFEFLVNHGTSTIFYYNNLTVKSLDIWKGFNQYFCFVQVFLHCFFHLLISCLFISVCLLHLYTLIFAF